MKPPLHICQAKLADAGFCSGQAAADGVVKDEEKDCYVATFTAGTERVQKEFKTFADAECWQKCMSSLRMRKQLLSGLAMMKKAASDQKATESAYAEVLKGDNDVGASPAAPGLDPSQGTNIFKQIFKPHAKFLETEQTALNHQACGLPTDKCSYL